MDINAVADGIYRNLYADQRTKVADGERRKAEGLATAKAVGGAIQDYQAEQAAGKSQATSDALTRAMLEGKGTGVARAEATGPNAAIVQEAADAKAARQPGFYDDLNAEDAMKVIRMRSAMQGMKDDEMAAGLRQRADARAESYLGIAERDRERIADEKRKREAAEALEASSDALKQGLTDGQAFSKNLAGSKRDAARATTREEYNAILDQVAGSIIGAQTAKLKGIPSNITEAVMPEFRGDAIAKLQKAMSKHSGNPEKVNAIRAQAAQRGISDAELGFFQSRNSSATGAAPEWQTP